MKIMYLARLTRPEILFAVTYLASKCSDPFKSDLRQLLRIIKYLKGTRDHGIHVAAGDLSTHLDVDASHVLHLDGKGHSGYLLTMGGTSYLAFQVSVHRKTAPVTEKIFIEYRYLPHTEADAINYQEKLK
jgi:hypothetical protein